ncbi:MAG TPA: hypothetical protein VNU68_13190 [Verrucomicrobiae bacterium]|nr:hypothetical protein [Verrucomicrobiae bacterium]
MAGQPLFRTRFVSATLPRATLRGAGLALLLLFLAASVPAAFSQLYISEILLNPPGSDSTNEYIELRGQPNALIADGTYLVSVEGDAEANPGTVQNLFDLSGRRVGQNGFLLLLQKFHRYKPNPLATVLTNSDSGSGWGSGSSSSLRHRGENGQGELENASATFFLIQTPTAPAIGDDIDADDNGTPDGAVYGSWTILDSVGLLDNDPGDIAYGQINFRRDTAPGNQAKTPDTSTIVPVPFTPSYVGRNGNTTGYAATNWVASDNLLGSAPHWYLGARSSTATNTWPANRAKAPLNHLGGPNFRAPILPGVIVRPSGTNTLVVESGLLDSYLLSLATRPTGAVTVSVTATSPIQISTDGGATYSTEGAVRFTSTAARRILVRVIDDGAAGPTESPRFITHSILQTLDPGNYPTSALIFALPVTFRDTNVVLLSEVKVNPPGSEDVPFEFIELRGPPGRRMTNLWLLAIQGNSSVNPGRVDLAVDLAGLQFGTNGLLMVAAPSHPYNFSPGTTVVLSPVLANAGGGLDNGTLSILLVGTTQQIQVGSDLDSGDNGVLEGLPPDAFIVDAIGWSDGGNGDRIYGDVDLSQKTFTPDAATRLPGKNTPRSASAWAVGDLAGTNGDSLAYDASNISTNLPLGSIMTPGVINKAAPIFTPNPLIPTSGVIGDPENEPVLFTVSDADTPAASLTVTATSTNQAVVPDGNLTLTRVSGGTWRLALDPVGVGYSRIILTVSDGVYSQRGFLDYAASAQGRPGAEWHTMVSDASTAIAIDANWMLVGDDENQVLRIFSRTRSGGPVAGQDFSSLLRLVDFYSNGVPKEVDIEASTRVGNRLFWLGSHSHAFNATERTNRARLFGTDLVGSGSNAVLRFLAHYDFLKLDLLAWDQNNVHGLGANYYGLAASAAEGVNPKAPDGSGFNLEGLCMAPGSTTSAYIAFRAPLVPPSARSNALLIPVLNFTTLATRPSGLGSARFGPPIELNLGGRGVRSIEGVGTNYLIVAGPPGTGDNLPPPGNFRFFTWTGQTNNVPQERGADLSGLNPEGIVEVTPGPWSATNLFQILSDNGTNHYYGDEIEAKHLEVPQFKKFRVDTVALGPVVSPAPIIRAVKSYPNRVSITWSAQAGITYRLQMKPTLDGPWTDVPGPVLATDALATKTLAVTSDPQCFFRVLRE